MQANFQTTTLSCQLQFEHALKHHRQESGEIVPPSENSDYFEEETMAYIQVLRKRKNNQELLQYYQLAQHISTNNRPYNKANITHRAGRFLLEYFKDESQAILYLEDISLKNLDRLTNGAKREIIRRKPLRIPHLPHFGQGLTDNGADDLWCHAQNSVEDDWFPDPIDLPRTPSPEPLTKKRRRQEADHSDEEPIASPKRHQSGFSNPLGITITRTLEPPLFGDYQVITHPQTGHLTIDYQH